NDNNAVGVTVPNGTAIVELCFNVIGTSSTTVVFSNTPTPIEIIDSDENEVEFNSESGTITIGQTPPGAFAVNIPSVEACMGANFCMDVTASMFSNIQGAQFSIAYNTTHLGFAQITNLNANMPGLATASFNTATAGAIAFQWESTSGAGVTLTPNSVLFSVCFNKLTNSATSISITGSPTPIEIVDGNENVVNFNGATGQITCNPVQPLAFGQVDVVNLTCATVCNGSITIVNMLNGSGNYTYQWSVPGQSGNDAVNLCASTVTVTVTDTANGQTVSGTYNVISPPAITLSVNNITNILCAGASTGSISVGASGGGGNFTYSWGNQTGPTIANLAEGVYAVTATDQLGCSAQLNNIQVNELNDPILLAGNITLIPGTGTPGAINLTPTGGSSTYTYNWSGPNGYSFTGQDPNNITTAGEYCVTVTDAFNCTSSTCFIVYEALRLTIFNITDVCDGETNGAIDITVAGGSCAGLTYNWSRIGGPMNFSQMQDVSGLAAGQYRVVIMDCAGTSISADFTIESNPAIVLNASISNVVTLTDGAINLTASGGTGGFTFLWSNGAMTEDIANLSAGTYCVTVTDNAGCSEEACFPVQSAPLVINSAIAGSISCPGEADGCFNLAVSGGAPPLTVTIPSVGTFPLPTGQLEVCNLAAGNYSFTVLDAMGNTISDDFTITAPEPLTVAAVVINDTEDAGNSGVLSVTVAGGTGNTTLLLNGLAPRVGRNIVISALEGGVYTGIVEDANGCQAEVSFTIGTLTETSSLTDASCEGNLDGAITVTVSGGTLDYSYVWTMAGSQDTISMASSLGNLAPGIYFVVITDATGATLVREFEVETQSNFTVSPQVVSMPDCFDSDNGQLSVAVNNQGSSTGFFYEWELGGQMVGTAQQLSNAAPGSYTVVVVDNFGCETSGDIILNAPEPVVLEAIVNNISCDGRKDGNILVSASGGTGSLYSYVWSFNNFQGPQLTNLESGSYTVTATDVNDCSVVETYTIAGATPMIVTVDAEPDTDNCNGTLMATVLGGQPPFDFDWINVPNAPNSAIVTDLCFGEYFLVVTDNSGCSSVQVSGVIDNERFACLEERVVITPDGNGSNDEFILFCVDQYIDNHLEIYNRYGQLVFETSDYNNDWEGTSQNGEDLPAGPYYWVLDYTEPNGTAVQLRGSLTIVRD
ncbi:MAG: gliding motility-associated C-terminal domain-containing protein, partial [Saprospiraceae bacterium]